MDRTVDSAWLSRPRPRGWTGKLLPSAPLAAPSCIETRQVARAAPFALVGLLTFALLAPTELSLRLGPLRLSPYRVVLIACFFPLLAAWLQRRAGPLRTSDFALLGFALWGWLALAVDSGFAASIEPGGILLVESFGAYLVGRVCVRGLDDWRRLTAVVSAACVVSLALSLPEMLSGKRLVHDALGAVFGGAPNFVVEPRMGFARAFGTFDHPILNGVFGSTCLSLAWFGAGEPALRSHAPRTVLVAASAVTSLSSGALLSMAVQIALALYRRATRGVAARWQLFTCALLAAYGLISALSSRSGLQALIWYLAMDRTTASYRLLIWEHGGANVGAHPWFGIGRGDWERPEWMSASVDSFWLLTAMTYGLPALVLLAVAVLSALGAAGRRVQSDRALDRARSGWIFAWIALIFAGFTVHYWNNVFAFLGLLLGAGVWMGERERAQDAA